MEKNSALKPLGFKHFRNMWGAALLSNIGTFMQNMGAAWFLAAGGLSASWLGGLQAAGALPMLLFSLFAGVLSDLQDRQKIILWSQILQALAAFALAYFSAQGLLTPLLLIVFTFLIGIGTAFNMPAWTATLPDLIPEEDLTSAIALSGASVNIARAIGPALGGFLIGIYGIHFTFFANALTFVFVILVVLAWKDKDAKARAANRESYFQSAKLGVIHAIQSPALRAVLIRSFVTLFMAGALWALLPLIAKRKLQMSSSGLGILMASLGVGSLLGVLLLPRIKSRGTAIDSILSMGSVAFSIATVCTAFSESKWIVSLGLVLGGVGWIWIMATYNLCAQIAVAKWIQGRSLSLYLVITQGALALSGLLWGFLADVLGVESIFYISGALLIAQAGLIYVLPLNDLAQRNLKISEAFSKVEHDEAFSLEDGPIETRIVYKIDKENLDLFKEEAYKLRSVRLRSGAYNWSLLFNPKDADDITEVFWSCTWEDHLRQHQRMSMEDELTYRKLRSFHRGDQGPRVENQTSANLANQDFSKISDAPALQ